MKQLSLIALLALFSAPAMAYVGPGLGMGVIGTIFGVLAAIVLALFGLFWYPLKRALGKKKAGTADSTSPAVTQADNTPPTVAQDEQAGHPGTVPTRPENPAETRPDNHTTSHPAALNEAADSATANHSDSQVR